MTPASRRAWSILALACASAAPGCNQFGPRQRLDESRRYIQALRSENDQLKDQLLTLRNQNEDYSERAVDDSRRLSAQAESIEDYRRSIHAYQSENSQLRTAFREMRDSLPAAVRSAMGAPDSRLALEDAPEPTEAAEAAPTRSDRRKPVPTGMDDPAPSRGGWRSSRRGPAEGEPGLDPSP